MTALLVSHAGLIAAASFLVAFAFACLAMLDGKRAALQREACFGFLVPTCVFLFIASLPGAAP